MKWGKLLTAGLIASIVRYFVNSGFGYLFQDIYDPVSGLWRAMVTPVWFQNVVITDVIVSFLAVFAFVMVHKALGKKSEKTKKGAKFGLLAFMLRDVSLILVVFALMPVSLSIAAIWLVSGFITSMLNGQIIANIYS